jgi:uncharacterized delta-60 repeat protein
MNKNSSLLRYYYKCLLILIVSLIVIACGGGGGSELEVYLPPPQPTPSAQTLSASNVTSYGADLNGVVNPNGYSTQADFQWSGSPTLSYYSGTFDVPAGSGTAYQAITYSIKGLASSTTYYFRIHAYNIKGGGATGAIQSFTTPPDGALYWAKSYGGVDALHYRKNDWSYSIKRTNNGGFVTAGHTDGLGNQYGIMWVYKTNANGVMEWQKAYGETMGDSAYAVVQTSDGGYAVAGQSSHLWVLKLNSDGTINWQKRYGSGVAKSIQQTADGGFIIAGETSSYGMGAEDFLVMKLDSNGSIQWQKTYGGAGTEEAQAVVLSGDGGYVVAGWSNSFGTGDNDAWLLKLNGDGSVAWQKTYGGTQSDMANALLRTNDGKYVFAGYTDNNGVRLLFVKISGDGTLEWSKILGNTDWNEAKGIVQTSDGGYAVAGCTKCNATNSTALVMKFTKDGTLLWQKTYGYHRSLYAIDETGTGDLVTAGYFEVGFMDYDSQILKMSSDGTLPPLSTDISLIEFSSSIVEKNTSVTGIDVTAVAVDTNVSGSTTYATILQQAP